MGILSSLTNRRIRNTLVYLLCVLLFAPLHSAVADSSNRPKKETKLKALILYQAPKLIGWQTPAKQEAPVFRYCILDDPYLKQVLTGILDGKKSAGKPIDIVSFDENDPSQNCHILYIAHDSQMNGNNSAIGLFKRLQDEGVLIVGSNAAIITMGGHVSLNSFRNKIGFEISEDLLLGHQFKLNSRLAGFATIIKSKKLE
ncbi:MAG: YfiR family protein [Kordiimonadaceae bacterium]|nr:YfiR family protein [Kordiimonadaceae bacterium]